MDDGGVESRSTARDGSHAGHWGRGVLKEYVVVAATGCGAHAEMLTMDDGPQPTQRGDPLYLPNHSLSLSLSMPAHCLRTYTADVGPTYPQSNGPSSPRGPHHPQRNRAMALLVWLGWVPLPAPSL
ncbi:unnamed protein product [Sphenostylis stenocarpa]|uniref:Uncharacterized protein n=1 Tax=Sphenostylis stenocarpa TaxID=92480 RepID=A0AA86VJ95_9FABA|nr:unnamed protein product [Sphenostylis stenocarpa]